LDGEQVTDGRTARRERNRLDVVDATLALIDEGDLDPSLADISVRSGISERSVFRYFENLDDLRQAVIRRNFERVSPLLVLEHPGEGPVTERIRSFVGARLRLWVAVAGPARVARRHSPSVPDIASDVRRFRGILHAQVAAQFRPELEPLAPRQAEELRLMVEVVVSFGSWDLLTASYGLNQAQVQQAWCVAVERLLAV